MYPTKEPQFIYREQLLNLIHKNKINHLEHYVYDIYPSPFVCDRLKAKAAISILLPPAEFLIPMAL